MLKTRVGVIRGGPGHEYEVSLKSGASVLSNLPEKYEARDIFISREGEWHLAGLTIKPEEIVRHVDVVFNALHGEFGEDGGLQAILDNLNIPYTGSGRLASAVGINKESVKAICRAHGIKVPYGLTLADNFDLHQASQQVFLKIPPPWVIKPLDKGSSVGLFFARSHSELEAALAKAATVSDNLLIEEYIKGKEATCGVINNFRQERIYKLLPIEIRRPSTCPVWNYEDKYSGVTEEICPGCFSAEESAEIQTIAAKMHEILGLRHYSRSDFIVSSRGIYALEVNTLPGLTTESLLPKALAAIGCSYADFLDHTITLALSS
ncbi:MAG: hypothetical protein A2589_00910 [Candidatus Vogelbacteria bacterium RIFOXYD1_FULL_46_19]|uniref:D-alanine--D-alanine ligase n=1 Tax=Candidatus Vogelbacteria bacterium RIFOXYD1_FULL_46_19 TaxID=1802439 RepID=A0A1G2QFL7_9BACT|nr:MAG: hypothetical protein A2589_00910 [Candidatus Vogelbacteria bacterium RIFOXYD1_FULL_46_19]